MALKVYSAKCTISYGMGGYEDHYYVIIANSETEALGIALEQVEYSTA